jgi:DNA-binding NarL/FixJ family response regulator
MVGPAPREHPMGMEFSVSFESLPFQRPPMIPRLQKRPPNSFIPPTAAVQVSRILLVDDHPIVTAGLAALIAYEHDLRVCGIAQDYASTIEMMEAFRPDLIIADVCLQGHDGLELLKEIKSRCPKQRVLMLSMHDESVYAPRALRSGASGYVMKQEAMETVLTAIRRVLEGDVYLSAPMQKEMLRRLLRGECAPAQDPFEALSDRELEVFRRIGQAQTPREIAAQLHLSIKTIETHCGHLMKKLHLTQRRDLLSCALAGQPGELGVEGRTCHAVQTPADFWPAAISGSAQSVGANTP